MFHFGTDHNQERRDGFVSFRCFLWLGGGGERTEEDGRGLGEDGNVNRGGGERTWRMMEEDSERMGTGIGGGGGGERTLRKKKRGSEQDETRTLRREENGTQRENENKDSEKEETDFEKDENGTFRRKKTGL